MAWIWKSRFFTIRYAFRSSQSLIIILVIIDLFPHLLISRPWRTSMISANHVWKRLKWKREKVSEDWQNRTLSLRNASESESVVDWYFVISSACCMKRNADIPSTVFKSIFYYSREWMHSIYTSIDLLQTALVDALLSCDEVGVE